MSKNIGIIIFIQLQYACGLHNNNEEPYKVTLIDSLKWDIYAANFENLAVNIYHPDSILDPVQCELGTWKIDTSIVDTIEYYFYTFYKSDTNRYAMRESPVAGIGFSKAGNKYPVGGFFKFLFENNPDSCKLYFEQNNLNFISYLQSYKGEIDPWLKKEAIRRNVLK